jgi:hypothetical protein
LNANFDLHHRVKLAMRNMVRKRGKSIYHFTLTTIGLLGTLVVLSYLTR